MRSTPNYSPLIAWYSDQFNLASAFAGIFFTGLNMAYAVYTYQNENPNFLADEKIQSTVDVAASVFSALAFFSVVGVSLFKKYREYQLAVERERNILAQAFQEFATPPHTNPLALTQYESAVYAISDAGFLGFCNVLRFNNSFLERISGTAASRLSYLIISVLGIFFPFLLKGIQYQLKQKSDLIKVLLAFPAESGPFIGTAFAIFFLQMQNNSKIQPEEAAFFGYFILALTLAKGVLNYIALKKMHTNDLQAVNAFSQNPLSAQHTLLEKFLWFSFLLINTFTKGIEPFANFLAALNIFSLSRFSINKFADLPMKALSGFTATVGIGAGLHNAIWSVTKAIRQPNQTDATSSINTTLPSDNNILHLNTL